MASKYLQQFPVPRSFPDVLHDFAREVLREQPDDIEHFGFLYFKALEEGKPFEYNGPHRGAIPPKTGPKPTGGKVMQASGKPQEEEKFAPAKNDPPQPERVTSPQAQSQGADPHGRTQSQESYDAQQYIAEVLDKASQGEVEGASGDGGLPLPRDELVKKIATQRKSFPDNTMHQAWDQAYYDSLNDDKKIRLLKACIASIMHPEVLMGVFAQGQNDYEEFYPFFRKALEIYHKVDLNKKKHTNNWDLNSVDGLPAGNVLDLKNIGISDPLSVRVRTGRNLKKYPLPGGMSRQQRVDMEVDLDVVFAKLIAKPEFGGRYYSLTPGHKDHMNDKQYQELVDAHIMFKDMTTTKTLNTSGVASEWPYGRGCYVSSDKGFIIWVGEEDHLRIMAMKKTSVLNEVFDRLKAAIDTVEESIPGGTIKSPEFGVVTSCPTNCGTGMRASVLIKIPNLTKGGSEKHAIELLKPFGLAVRGMMGEHTPIGPDGTVDISPKARFCITEAEIVAALYKGVKVVWEEEQKAGGSSASAPSTGLPLSNDELVKKIAAQKAKYPDNTMHQAWDQAYYDTLDDDKKTRLLKACIASIQHPEVLMGVFAQGQNDYEEFYPFFRKALEIYHKVDLNKKKHTNNWDLNTVDGLPDDKILNLTNVGIPEPLSVRVRTGRNLQKYPLPGGMSRQQRVDMEVDLDVVFAKLISKPEFGGRYYSLTPGHKDLMDDKQYQELVDAHIMFKDMTTTKTLNTSGVASEWPYGRGCYVSSDKGFIIWVGEEDHLRIMAMKKTSVLNEVFDRLKAAIDTVEESIPGGTIKSPEFGVVTSCPTNCGTGMRASVLIKIPNLTKGGSEKHAIELLKPFGLAVRGMMGEHTPIGPDGTVDISPKARFCITEAEIVAALYKGVKVVWEEEQKAGSGAPAGALPLSNDELVKKIKEQVAKYPDNTMHQAWDQAYYDSLDDDKKTRLLKACIASIMHPEVLMGVFAQGQNDYEEFYPFFRKALEIYHKVDLNQKKHTNNWDLNTVDGLPEDKVLNLTNVGIPEPLSVRVRTGRNLQKYPLPGGMSRQQRIDMEVDLDVVFAKLIAKPEFGGRYYSLTPGHKDLMDEKQYQELVDAHIMFKDMTTTKTLNTSGVASEWPYGRGCYVSSDKGFIIWVGEEDHMRIMAMKKTSVLNEVFDRLKAAIDTVEESIPGGTIKSPEFGVVTSCPTNCGTGMRASVLIKIPNLTKGGSEKHAIELLKPFGLAVRGMMGEHTPIGPDGTVDISPKARFCITEAEIVAALYKGVKVVWEEEQKAASGAPAGALPLSNDELVKKIAEQKAKYPDNTMHQAWDQAYYDSLDDDKKTRLLKACIASIQHPEVLMGVFAQGQNDYEEFYPFFRKALEIYHKVDLNEKKHTNNWDLNTVDGLPEDKVLNLTNVGIPEPLSVRVRTGRNLQKYPLPGGMTRQQRIDMEVDLDVVFAKLIAKPEFGGRYYSLTPGHKDLMDEKQYQELVDAHIMFKDMTTTKTLNTSGVASEWPYGRGCYVSSDKGFIIWVGEEDHMRIMAMKKTSVLNEVFDRLKAAIDTVEESIPGGTIKSPEFGVVTSCPTNCGTGMRASVLIKIPNLTKDGSEKHAIELLKPFGLAVRGMMGEHTPIGPDGTVDISPKARFCITEAEIVAALYKGVKVVWEEEQKAASGSSAGDLPLPKEELIKKIAEQKAKYPDNTMHQAWDQAYYDSLDDDKKTRLLKACIASIQHPEVLMGVFAQGQNDYEEFYPFFRKALEIYHKVDLNEKKHTNNWDLNTVDGLPEDKVLNLTNAGIPDPLSVRVRTGRNLQKYPLPGGMSRQQRIDMEVDLDVVFAKLIARPEFGGRYYSLTPGHKDLMDEKQYQELVDAHIMFKDMTTTKTLNTSGVASEWPYGRGCYVSEDKGFIIWVGEEDHMRIMAMKKTSVLNEVFDRLKAAIDTVEESIPGGTIKSPEFGVVTSCPTNCGTGMRASVLIKIPNLTKDGSEKHAIELLKPFGLAVRGMMGEHTPIGPDGTVDISPKARFCITEAEILAALYKGVKTVWEEEQKAGAQ